MGRLCCWRRQDLPRVERDRTLQLVRPLAAATMQECQRSGQDARGALCHNASTGTSKRGARTAAEAAFVRMHVRGGPAKTAGGAASASICGNGDRARSAGGASCAHMADSVACATIAAAAASASTSDKNCNGTSICEHGRARTTCQQCSRCAPRMALTRWMCSSRLRQGLGVGTL